MRKVKYTPIIGDLKYRNLTSGKIYDIISYNSDSHKGYICIWLLNDDGIEDWFLYTNDVSEFIDVTSEYRSEIIDCILE